MPTDHENARPVVEKFRCNLRAMRNRIKDRVRVASWSYGSFRQGHMPSLNGATALRATATGLVAARVFKGNVIFSRLVHGRAKQELATKMAKYMDYFPNFKSLIPNTLAVSDAAGESNAPVTVRIHDRVLKHAAKESNANQEPVNVEESGMVRMLQAVAVPLLGNVCHAFMHGLNYTEVYGAEKLQEAIKYRPKGQPLITVSNHVASVDDPFVISSVLPPQLLLDAKSLRWTLCATDRCFTNPVTSAFFRSVKVLPVARGDGIYQKGMNMALSKLNQGDWVHIFPEGSRSRDGGKTVGPAKRGVGRLVLDAEKMPLVVPFVHTGMQEIMPIGSQFPHVRKKVTVLIGDPIRVDDLFMAGKEQGLSKMEIYDAISQRVGEGLQELKNELDELVYQNSLEISNSHYLSTMEKVNGAFQFDEWETHDFSSCEKVIENGDVVHLYLVRSKSESHALSQKNLKTNDTHNQVNGIQKNQNFLREGDILAENVGFQGGIVSRVKEFMDPSELMGFAARGMLMNAKRRLGQSLASHDWKQAIVMNLV
ncbi:hypothetical protein SUGI_0995110 [Cryptomeria japonica]|uniref:uncharacterized protein LOC131052599 n=1 Tax=Cryptomeria japonica TaxID=3369 RepID=UPI002414B8D1|nr:uncharacterized protein LOC131052599 [Cryptomeria japonica]GLJ47131.1 hypothetical protein SUGI_0995110 [Cryptomeria japonica]